MVVLPRAGLLLAVALASTLAASVATGCGLDAGGLAAGSADAAAVGPDSTAPPDGTSPGEPVDASADVSFPVLDAATCTADACAVAAPAGWTLVAFAASRADACPAALTTVDVVEASVQAPGCSCGCTPQTQPNCDTGSVAQMWDGTGNAACNLTNPAFTTTGCNFPGWNLLNGHLQLTAPAPTNGTCTSAATPDTSALQTTDERVCAPSVDACAACSSLPASFQTCALHGGDVACPSAQLPTKHLVGSQANLSCSGSCGSCQLSATSCTGTLTFYTDTQCSSGPTVFTADGTCQPANLNIQRYQWQGAPVGVTCQGSAPPTATLGLSNQATVCCP